MCFQAARQVIGIGVAGAEVIVPNRTGVELAVLIIEEHRAHIKVKGFEKFIEQIELGKGRHVDFFGYLLRIAAANSGYDLIHGALDIVKLRLVRLLRFACDKAQTLHDEIGDVVLLTSCLIFDQKVVFAIVALDVDIDPVLSLLHRLGQKITAAKNAVYPQLGKTEFGGVGKPQLLCQ